MCERRLHLLRAWLLRSVTRNFPSTSFRAAISSLRASLEARFQHLVDELENLKAKVGRLEWQAGEAVDTQPKRQEEIMSLHSKVEAMATTMTNQQ